MKKICMNLYKCLGVVAIAGSTTVFSVCAWSSDYKWKEEAALNNGEILWVARKMTFERASEPGNPLSTGWRPVKNELSFVWRGKPYSYSGSAMVLAVGPEGQLDIVRALTRQDIYTAGIKCRKPSYVQLRLVGTEWRPLPEIETWALDLVRNQLLTVNPGQVPSVVDTTYRLNLDSTNSAFSQYRENQLIDRTFIASFCKGKI